MTEIVVDKLNNIEEVLSVGSGSKKSAMSDVIGMDKSESFKKVFDKVNALKEQDSKQTISTLKNKEENLSQEKVSVDDWIDFKKILTQTTEEANIETSLDLTLAKDINEIITQLKEAIENASDIIDNSSDDGEVISEEIENVVDIVEEIVDNVQVEELVDSQLEDKLDDVGVKKVLEQALAYVDKTLDTKIDFAKSSDMEVNKSTETVDLKTSIDLSQFELVETAEEVVVNSSNKDSLVEDIDLSIDEEVLKELKIESIQADTSSFEGENLMQNQAPEEHAVKVMINDSIESFELKIDSQQNIQSTQQVQAKPVDMNPSRIIEQITKQLEGLQNNSKVNIVLNPESLGKVNIQLLTAKDGLTAQFTVTTQEAKDLLMKGLDGLKESLLSHGVAVDNVSVKVADTQKSEYNQDWTEQEGSKGGNKGQGQPEKEEKEKGLFEKMMAQVTDEENGNV